MSAGASPFHNAAHATCARANVCPCLQGGIGCAVTGKGFAALQATADLAGLHAVLQHAAVFARMAPADKQRLVELLGEGCSTEGGQATPGLQHFVAFCGDGSNDVAALKVGTLLRHWLFLSFAQAGYTRLWAQQFGLQVTVAVCSLVCSGSAHARVLLWVGDCPSHPEGVKAPPAGSADCAAGMSTTLQSC